MSPLRLRVLCRTEDVLWRMGAGCTAVSECDVEFRSESECKMQSARSHPSALTVRPLMSVTRDVSCPSKSQPCRILQQPLSLRSVTPDPAQQLHRCLPPNASGLEPNESVSCDNINHCMVITNLQCVKIGRERGSPRGGSASQYRTDHSTPSA